MRAARIRRHRVRRATRWRGAIAPLRASPRAHEGLIFEDKGLSVALHYRLAPAARARGARRGARRRGRELGERYEVLPRQDGARAAAQRPRQGRRDPGVHARAAVRPPRAGVPRRRPTPTSTASRVVNRLGGHSVKVGAGATAARWSLPDPAGGARVAGAVDRGGAGRIGVLKKIAVLTSGGDAPGMNAAVRAVTRGALAQGLGGVRRAQRLRRPARRHHRAARRARRRRHRAAAAAPCSAARAARSSSQPAGRAQALAQSRRAAASTRWW